MMQASASGSATGAAMAQRMRDQLFSRADRDGDGSLSAGEFRRLGKDRPAEASGNRAMDAAFRSLDADGGGQLTNAELARGRRGHAPSGATGMNSLSTLLAAQENAAAGGGLQAVVARMLQAYGGTA
jgi:Ca2+-binding EF-hand superfamily protein